MDVNHYDKMNHYVWMTQRQSTNPFNHHQPTNPPNTIQQPPPTHQPTDQPTQHPPRPYRAQKEGELARDLRIVLEKLGPTFIKLGQALSIRPDVVCVRACLPAFLSFIQPTHSYSHTHSPNRHTSIRPSTPSFIPTHTFLLPHTFPTN